MRERLQKIIAMRGAASRRSAEKLIAAGRVAVNGNVITELGSKADPAADVITVDGVALPPPVVPRVIMLNKPRGWLSTCRTSRERGRSVLELIPEDRRFFPVGRLDRDSTGLLLLTDDGDLAFRLSHPRHETRKTYYVETAQRLTADQIDLLRRGVMLDDGPAQAAGIRRIDDFSMNVILTEGRNRQIRRMVAAAGNRVEVLHRVGIGTLKLGDLQLGTWRDLTPFELERLATGNSTQSDLQRR